MYERMTQQMETFPFEFQVDIPSLGIRRVAKGFMINLSYDTNRRGFYNIERFRESLVLHFAVGYPF